jgi:hypothetical protein
MLTRYSISGLIWGREVVWLDARQRLVALVGIDAEFDHFEATAEGYASLLPNFVATAAQDGMAALAELSQRVRVTQKGPLAIVGATLIDGTASSPVLDSVVIVDNGRIVSVGTRASSRIPRGPRSSMRAERRCCPDSGTCTRISSRSSGVRSTWRLA